jgi:hypothetical protein
MQGGIIRVGCMLGDWGRGDQNRKAGKVLGNGIDTLSGTGLDLHTVYNWRDVQSQKKPYLDLKIQG